MNTIRQSNRRFAGILTSLLYPRSSGGTLYNQENRRQINSKSILPPAILVDKEKSDLKKQTNPLLEKLNNTKFTDFNMPRNLLIDDPIIYTMDATRNPVIFQFRNQKNEIIRTMKMSDAFHLITNNKPSSASHENNQILYSYDPVLNNSIRSSMKLQPMSLADYENDLQELIILFKQFRNKEPPFDDSDLEMFSRMVKDFNKIRYSDQILLPESSDDDELVFL